MIAMMRSAFFSVLLALAACSSGDPSRDAGPGRPDGTAGPVDAGFALDATVEDGSISNELVGIRIVTFSDWHGQLDPVEVEGASVGGAAVLAAHFRRERAENPLTLVLTAGDTFGASPPLAAFFDDEPAVLALNLMGLDATTFGNHDFDRGLAPLQRLIDLATFSFVSSNLDRLDENLSGAVSPFLIEELGGVKVALIGLTNPDAFSLVPPGSGGTISTRPLAAAAASAREAAAAAGATVFVALVHAGALLKTSPDTWAGPLIDFAGAVQGFDVIVGDHTDLEVNTVINGAIVVENRSRGLTYARVLLEVDPATGAVAHKSAEIFQPLASAVTPDPAVEAMLDPFRTQLSARLDRPAGIATAIFPRENERIQEIALGDLIAGAFRQRYGTQLAFLNGGGIRAALPSTYAPADLSLRRPAAGYAAGPPYDLVSGDAHAILPFGNVVVTREVTGAQLWAAMEHGVRSVPRPDGAFPQIAGFTFTFGTSAPPGSRIQSMALEDGTPIAPDETVYTLATTDHLNGGGSGFTMLADGQGTTRELEAQVLAEYLEATGTVTPVVGDRIRAVP